MIVTERHANNSLPFLDMPVLLKRAKKDLPEIFHEPLANNFYDKYAEQENVATKKLVWKLVIGISGQMYF